MTIFPNVLVVMKEYNKQYLDDKNGKQADINKVLDQAHNIIESSALRKKITGQLVTEKNRAVTCLKIRYDDVF